MFKIWISMEVKCMFLLKWGFKFVLRLMQFSLNAEHYEPAQDLMLKSFSTGVFEVWGVSPRLH